jgi:hypothetical protein
VHKKCLRTIQAGNAGRANMYYTMAKATMIYWIHATIAYNGWSEGLQLYFMVILPKTNYSANWQTEPVLVNLNFCCEPYTLKTPWIAPPIACHKCSGNRTRDRSGDRCANWLSTAPLWQPRVVITSTEILRGQVWYEISHFEPGRQQDIWDMQPPVEPVHSAPC